MMSELYDQLAHVYDAAGFSDYADYYTEIFLTFLHQKGWLGRRILELGCGTGVSIATFTDQRMFVTGVDLSANMLEVARQRFQKIQASITLIQEDIRNYTPQEKGFDLVFCIGDVLNYMPTLRDLEMLFQRVNTALDIGKPFLFDLRTIQGLAQNLGQTTQIVHDSDDIFVVVKNQYNYEISALEREYTFFYRNERGVFVKSQETHLLRGYPYRAVMNVLSRGGFEVKTAVNLDLETYDPTNDPYGRVVVIAEKTQDYSPNTR